ncbi:hypothetical protein COO91_02390 [Nostoc flagelliforme CCNUN1]|uniref:Uncharacterized protein n=1 Tax=Nostoc flagelliforme CCNUN1 TaxID=2038116 RepID=A0A2K8SM39_9NOSO|nr:hypothetical protein COO91_02390 [Nostoc flagelliforme CCNUN1]
MYSILNKALVDAESAPFGYFIPGNPAGIMRNSLILPRQKQALSVM